jgi:hypothetical protein
MISGPSNTVIVDKDPRRYLKLKPINEHMSKAKPFCCETWKTPVILPDVPWFKRNITGRIPLTVDADLRTIISQYNPSFGDQLEQFVDLRDPQQELTIFLPHEHDTLFDALINKLILELHVVDGNFLLNNQSGRVSLVSKFGSKLIEIDGQKTANGIAVLIPNIVGRNGTVHVIETSMRSR